MTGGGEGLRFDREAADATAGRWEARHEFVEAMAAPVCEWMLSELAPQEGDTVLELAAGAAELGLTAARSAGRVVVTDVSEEMLAAARRRGANLGDANVEYRIADAERTGLDEASVDGILCRFGYQVVPDPGAAFAEARRVLRPGGRLVFAVWGPALRNPFFALPAMTLIQEGHLARPEPGTASPFSLADPEATERLVSAGGFSSVRSESLAVEFGVSTAEDLLELTEDLAGPIGLVVQGLDSPARTAVCEHLAKAMGRYGDHLPGEVLCVVAS